jgi:hypothetical protein
VKVLTGNLHSLASGQSVRFDDKIAKVQQVLFDAINGLENLMLGVARDLVASSQLSSEGLAGFQARPGSRGSNARNSQLRTKFVDDSRRKRVLRTRHHEIRRVVAKRGDCFPYALRPFP